MRLTKDIVISVQVKSISEIFGIPQEILMQLNAQGHLQVTLSEDPTFEHLWRSLTQIFDGYSFNISWNSSFYDMANWETVRSLYLKPKDEFIALITPTRFLKITCSPKGTSYLKSNILEKLKPNEALITLIYNNEIRVQDLLQTLEESDLFKEGAYKISSIIINGIPIENVKENYNKFIKSYGNNFREIQNITINIEEVKISTTPQINPSQSTQIIEESSIDTRKKTLSSYSRQIISLLSGVSLSGFVLYCKPFSSNINYAAAALLTLGSCAICYFNKNSTGKNSAL